jgi:hypothetical protein
MAAQPASARAGIAKTRTTVPETGRKYIGRGKKTSGKLTYLLSHVRLAKGESA